jgi:hypothetical protein
MVLTCPKVQDRVIKFLRNRPKLPHFLRKRIIEETGQSFTGVPEGRVPRFLPVSRNRK